MYLFDLDVAFNLSYILYLQIPTRVQEGARPALPPKDSLPRVPNDENPSDDILERYIAVMNNCWAQNQHDRPKFQLIITQLRELV